MTRRNFLKLLSAAPFFKIFLPFVTKQQAQRGLTLPYSLPFRM